MSATEIISIDVDGQRLRVGMRRGEGTPLLLCNGIGASLELFEPMMEALDGVATITFDVPGIGGSPPRLKPYRLRTLARLADRMLAHLGYRGPVDVLGMSWGGTLAQQFARTCRARCRSLVLAATTPGALMIPGSPFLLAKMFNSRRYTDADFMRRIAPDLYGGEVRRNPGLVEQHRALSTRPHWRGYLYQQLALSGWSSLPWLRLLRQRTLVLAGSDDPLVPLANARLMARLIPHAELNVIDDGHLFMVSHPHKVAPLIRKFLAQPALRH